MPYLDKENEDIELDFNKVYRTLFRNRYLVAGITFLAALCSVINVSLKKRVWEGQFQIVVSNSSSSGNLAQLMRANSSLEQLAGFAGGGQSKSVSTEIEILKSPSILLPIYNYVKSEKKKDGIDVDKWNYKKWIRDYLSIQRQRTTTVLNISYKDTDSQLI